MLGEVMIWGEKLTDIVRGCGLHFALGFAVGVLVLWLTTHTAGIWDVFRFGFLGAFAGMVVDVDHWLNTQSIALADPGRPLHIPLAVFAVGVLIYCVVRIAGSNIMNYVYLSWLVVSASVVAHVLEDYLLNWF